MWFVQASVFIRDACAAGLVRRAVGMRRLRHRRARQQHRLHTQHGVHQEPDRGAAGENRRAPSYSQVSNLVVAAVADAAASLCCDAT